jgi:hypothetical protein
MARQLARHAVRLGREKLSALCRRGGEDGADGRQPEPERAQHADGERVGSLRAAVVTIARADVDVRRHQ